MTTAATRAGDAEDALLRLRDLHVSFPTSEGDVPAVRGVDLSLGSGETLAVVGESGSGKTVTALAIMGLLDPPGRVSGGSVWFDGQELTSLPSASLRRIRGRRIGMVFQEPMTSLNPVFTVGDQIAEVLRIHLGASKRQAREEVIQLLARVGIPAPESRVDAYPHEMSGGMKQRVMIAIAIACKPDLLIADEPTTALDVTIQAQILKLLSDLQQEMGMAILLITHNLGVVAHFARDVAVMYAGKVVERAGVRELFARPQHPYTRALLRSLPRPGHAHERLEAIEGTVPSPLQYPPGCAFVDRCPERLPRCPDQQPRLVEVESDHAAACWLHPEVVAAGPEGS
jgi:oligopeptide/dipeptide ABC transporter ATP-binding protein